MGVRRLTAAIVKGGELTALIVALETHERQRREVSARLAALHSPVPRFDARTVRRELGDYLIDWQKLLSGHVHQAQQNAWTHSPEERVIERFTRNAKNYLTYQYTVIDPVVLLKPLVSAPHTWTLAQDANDVWSEYLCTANEDAFAFDKMTPAGRKEAEERLRGGAQ